MGSMTKFQEFFFHHSDKDVPSAEEARKQFTQEFAELVMEKSAWIEPLLEEGKSYEEIAAHHKENPSTTGDLVGFYSDADNLFLILEASGEVDKGSLGYTLYRDFLYELQLVNLAKLLGIPLE